MSEKKTPEQVLAALVSASNDLFEFSVTELNELQVDAMNEGGCVGDDLISLIESVINEKTGGDSYDE